MGIISEDEKRAINLAWAMEPHSRNNPKSAAKMGIKNNRERGWFDKSILVFDNNIGSDWLGVVGDWCRDYSYVSWKPDDAYFDADAHYNTQGEPLDPRFTGWTKGADGEVVRIQAPPPPYARTPVRSALDAVFQTSDGIILFLHPPTGEAHHHIEFIEKCCRGMDYNTEHLKYLNSAVLEPKPPKLKARALVVVFGESYNPNYFTAEQIDKDYAKWQEFCREKGYPLIRLPLTKDLAERKAVSQKILYTVLDEIKHERGVKVETEFYPNEVLETEFKALQVKSQPPVDYGYSQQQAQRNSLWGKFKRAVGFH